MRKGIIYKFSNKQNGKVYIGQTVNERERYLAHKNCYGKCYFHNAISKYGFDSFDYEVLYTVEDQSLEQIKFILDDRERQFILEYRSNDPKYGYNLNSGGHSCFAISQETRNKQSEAHKGKKGYWNGKAFSEEHRKNLSKARAGKHVSRKSGYDNPLRYKPLYVNDTLFQSRKEAAEFLGIKPYYLARAVKRGYYKSYKIKEYESLFDK